MPVAQTRAKSIALGTNCVIFGYGIHLNPDGTVAANSSAQLRFATVTVTGRSGDAVRIGYGTGMADHGDSGGPIFCDTGSPGVNGVAATKADGTPGWDEPLLESIGKEGIYAEAAPGFVRHVLYRYGYLRNDYNGDGRADLVFASGLMSFQGKVGTCGSTQTVQERTTVGDAPILHPTPESERHPPGYELVATGDFNRDGYSDLVLYNSTTGFLLVHYLFGANWLASSKAHFLGKNVRPFSAGDIDGDGLDDLLVLSSSGRALAFYGLTEDELTFRDFLRTARGPCTPKEAGISCDVIRELGPTIPTLGVCLGHQSIGDVFGGDVVRADRIMHGKMSSIRHNGNRLFEGVENPFRATRYHSLIIKRATCPECLDIIAETEDMGEIMGVAHKQYPVWGVQFHPESILTKPGKQIIRNFLAA